MLALRFHRSLCGSFKKQDHLPLPSMLLVLVKRYRRRLHRTGVGLNGYKHFWPNDVANVSLFAFVTTQ
jgi:hypothetical protein